MSVRCRQCNYLITDPWANGCPLCGAPYSGGGGGGFRGGGGEGGGSRTPLYLGLGVVFAILVGGSLLNRFGGRGDDPQPNGPVQADSTGRIRVGMRMADVVRELDGDAGRRRSNPDSIAAKHPDIDTKGGVLQWSKGGRALVILFDRGGVVGVVEVPAEPGSPEQFEVAYHDDVRPPGDEP